MISLVLPVLNGIFLYFLFVCAMTTFFTFFIKKENLCKIPIGVGFSHYFFFLLIYSETESLFQYCLLLFFLLSNCVQMAQCLLILYQSKRQSNCNINLYIGFIFSVALYFFSVFVNVLYCYLLYLQLIYTNLFLIVIHLGISRYDEKWFL